MLKIVMPMAGEGRPFAEHRFPKPLIEIHGKATIEYVVHNSRPTEDHQFVFICKGVHLRTFALREVLALVAPGSCVIPAHNRTAGALCSVLLAKEHLLEESELLIVNSDQYVDGSVDAFLGDARSRALDGSILTFPSNHPKWSYARLERDQVVAVAEKRPISNHATAGWYYFRSTRDFLIGAETLLVKRAMELDEYYVCPVYNELILAGKRIGISSVKRNQVHSLGSPEDIAEFAAGRGERVKLASTPTMTETC